MVYSLIIVKKNNIGHWLLLLRYRTWCNHCYNVDVGAMKQITRVLCLGYSSFWWQHVQHWRLMFWRWNMGYHKDNKLFYVSSTNWEGKLLSENYEVNWNVHWKMASVKFEAFLNADPYLFHFSRKMFFYRTIIKAYKLGDHSHVTCIQMNLPNISPWIASC